MEKKEKGNNKKQESSESEAVVYEVGYHIIPTVAEEDVLSEVSTLKDIIESADGAIISDENPKFMRLAYPISHVVANEKSVYDSAYFGWIKFFALPDSIAKIKNGISSNNKVLRFLIIKTVREDTTTRRMLTRQKQEIGIGKQEQSADAQKEISLSPEELDKTIEELVIE